jgi:pilus assembly protein CpaC
MTRQPHPTSFLRKGRRQKAPLPGQACLLAALAIAAAACVFPVPRARGQLALSDAGGPAPSEASGSHAALAGMQEGEEGEPEAVEISVRSVETEGQLIRVPVNKSVVVDFSEPVREVRVAKPEFAEVTALSPTQILVTGKSFGTTQLIARLDGDAKRVFDLAVDIELDRLMASVRSAVPRARVRAYALLDAVVLAGEVPDAESADQVMQIAGVFSPNVINQMRVAGMQQVLLRVTVAEVNRSIVKQLGFNGFLAGENFRDAFVAHNLDQINPSNIGAAADALVTRNVPFLTGEDGIPITQATTLSLGFPRVQMQVFIRALSENGLLRVLAEPNLVAINGQQASFLAGGETPIPIVTDERIRVEFKEFGVRLNFTPAVIGEDRIRLEVSPELSEPDFSNAVTVSGFVIPAFTSRRVHTVVELGSGETFAIGGLLSETIRAVSRRVPGLGDVPVLGALFRSVEYQSDETEMVVLVTPEIVGPVSPDQITSVPGANYVPPNDFELYMLGEIEGEQTGDMPVLQPRVNHTWPVRPGDLYGTSAVLRLRGPLGPAGYEEGS